MIEKNKGGNKIAEFIYDDYLFNRDLQTNNQVLGSLNLLVENGLAIMIKGDACQARYVNKFNIASYLMCKYNKKVKKNLKDVEDYLKKKYVDDDEEFLELLKYNLEDGTYYADLKNSNYAILKVSSSEDSRSRADTFFEFYFIGNKCEKYKNKFFKMYKKYKDKEDKSEKDYIFYSDPKPATETRFKPFDKMIFKDKEKILKYIDNWIDNIPEYYKFGMTPKLSILLYGAPGGGKSSFYQALANYLGINRVYSYSQNYFYSTAGLSNDGGGRRGRMHYIDGIIALDDIDTFAKSREEEQSRENGLIMNNLLTFLDNPGTFYFKAKDGIYYPITIIVATTNYYDRLDDAVKRYGRFDLKIEMKYFDKKQAQEMCDLYNLKLKDVVKTEITDDFTISPAECQALCLENIDKALKNKK